MSDRKRVTMRDVAAEAGVSETTVVFVLNDKPGFSVQEETRRRIHDAARRLGYRRNGLAAALSRGRTGSIGVVVPTLSAPGGPRLGEEFLLGVLLGMTHAVASANLRLTTIPYAMDRPPTPEEVTDQRVDGLVLVALRDEAFARAIYDTGFPCVTFGSGYARLRVAADNVGGAVQAVEHLIGLGHRRIAYFALGESESDAQRAQGWRDTLARHALPEGFTAADENEIADAVAEGDPGERPTAVFCHSDVHAVRLMTALRRRKQEVPRDLSVVGFDNGIAAQAVGLTTIHNPVDKQALLAVRLLERLIVGEAPEPPAPLPTELIVRHTTAPIDPVAIAAAAGCPADRPLILAPSST